MATAEQIAIFRTIVPDDAAVYGVNGDEYMFTDTQIDAFYTIGGGSHLRAAAYANYAIATSEAIISKKIVTEDLETDGAAIATALIKKGDALMAQADKENWDTFMLVPNSRNIPPELTEWPFDGTYPYGY